MELHKQHQSHPLFDIKDAIIRSGNQPCPVDLKPWQDRIDRLAGKSLDGLSRLKIVWGQSFDQTKMIVKGRWRLKYPYYRYYDEGLIQDIGIPRFYLEELRSRAQINRQGAWDKARFYKDPDTGLITDMFGPIPETGFYTCVFSIAHHDEVCCNGTGMQRVRGATGKWEERQCLGAYRPPCDADIQRIRRMIYNRDTATPEEICPSDALIEKRTEEMREKRDERDAARLRDYMDNWMAAHAWKWTEDDPTKLKWGKYHWMGSHTKGGGKISTPTPGTSFTVIDRRGTKEDANGSSGSV